MKVKRKKGQETALAFGFHELPQPLLQHSSEWFEGDWDQIKEKKERI